MTLEAMKQDGDADRRAPKKVLIVEDNDLNMKLFNDLLEAHGYFTLQTKDGVEALRMARQHRPDLILMDIQLPEVSGLEVTKWLKEDDDLRTIPVIAVTAFAMKGDEEKIRDGGCEAYIAKPISVASFMRTVERFLPSINSGLFRHDRPRFGRRRRRAQRQAARSQARRASISRSSAPITARARSTIAEAELPDIILLDVMMPRMDGFEVCRRLKANPRTADIPVVMVTALSDVADRLRGLEAGADDFLTKPVNDIALFARVRSLVRLKRMMDELRLREEVCGRFGTADPSERARRGRQCRAHPARRRAGLRGIADHRHAGAGRRLGVARRLLRRGASPARSIRSSWSSPACRCRMATRCVWSRSGGRTRPRASCRSC